MCDVQCMIHLQKKMKPDTIYMCTFFRLKVSVVFKAASFYVWHVTLDLFSTNFCFQNLEKLWYPSVNFFL